MQIRVKVTFQLAVPKNSLELWWWCKRKVGNVIQDTWLSVKVKERGVKFLWFEEFSTFTSFFCENTNFYDSIFLSQRSLPLIRNCIDRNLGQVNAVNSIVESIENALNCLPFAHWACLWPLTDDAHTQSTSLSRKINLLNFQFWRFIFAEKSNTWLKRQRKF